MTVQDGENRKENIWGGRLENPQMCCLGRLKKDGFNPVCEVQVGLGGS